MKSSGLSLAMVSYQSLVDIKLLLLTGISSSGLASGFPKFLIMAHYPKWTLYKLNGEGRSAPLACCAMGNQGPLALLLSII